MEGAEMLFAAARPIVQGKTDRARLIARELETHRVEYEALNARYGVRAHVMWVTHLAGGRDLWAYAYDMEPDDLATMRGRVFDPEHSAYDRWWLEWVNDVLGVDMLTGTGFAAPPEPIFDWSRP
jgi:hypothetical protein